ncbi:hypothetical protein CHUAL_010977 [Chamberlinius hualienensis]
MCEKLILVIFSLSFAVSMVVCCTSDAGCKVGECCRRRIPEMPFMKCSSLAKPDERCGGQTRCLCVPGYECVFEEPSFFNRMKVGNGTCQPISQMQQDAFKTFLDM